MGKNLKLLSPSKYKLTSADSADVGNAVRVVGAALGGVQCAVVTTFVA